MKEFEGCRVLLADDEEVDLEVVANIVEDLGAQCVKVHNGEEMLEVLNGPDGGRIDLVLTDINMPEKNGIDACSEFRASSNPRARTLPVIGISADANAATFDKAISAGMNSMTTKPLTRETLRSHFHITLRDNQANAVFSERIQQALAKSLFFSSVSHDIRTPLNAIIGFSEMLKSGLETKAERDLAVDSILVSSRMLLELVNDILDLSKLESGRMNIDPEPTDVATLVREIAASFGATHQKKGLEILCRAAGTPSLMVDPHRLRQIAFNFMGNAIKFTKKGFIEIRTSFKPDADGKAGVFRLEVEDTGCGIGEADLKKLARPFVQVGAVSTQRAGTGLGLHISRMLARAMGGDMEIKSALGKGSTFSIVVPGVKVAGGEVGGNSWSSRKEQFHSPTPNSLTSLRILVVDDTKMNQIVLKAMLGKIGVGDVVFADNGREALEMLRSPESSPFDLVLTDFFMPVMTGEELVAAIRADPALKGLCVGVFTADVEMKDAYAKKGFSAVLLKPATLDTLREFVEFAAPAAGR